MKFQADEIFCRFFFQICEGPFWEMAGVGDLFSDDKCFEMIREIRWDGGVHCVECQSTEISRNGFVRSSGCWRYLCKACGKNFDDMSSTVLSGNHLPVRNWVLCLYFMGLNVSNRQIAEELGLQENTVQNMATTLRSEVARKLPETTLWSG